MMAGTLAGCSHEIQETTGDPFSEGKYPLQLYAEVNGMHPGSDGKDYTLSEATKHHLWYAILGDPLSVNMIPHFVKPAFSRIFCMMKLSECVSALRFGMRCRHHSMHASATPCAMPEDASL